MTLSSTVSRLEMSELTGRGAHIIVWLYAITTTILAIWTIDGVRSPYPTLVALMIFVIVAVVVTRDRGSRISLPVSLFIIAAGVANTLLVSWQVLYLGYTQWYFGAAAVALFYISLRGRIGLAWLGFAPVAVIMGIWGMSTGLTLASAAVLVARQLPMLIVGTLFATGLRRTGNDIERYTTEASARAVAEAASIATARERELRLLALGELAIPLLERLASGAVPTDAERLDFALAEAELRDGLRARSLRRPDVTTAARAARRRGVEVVLLDDSDPAMLRAEDLTEAAATISALLNRAMDGRVTARLLPPGREAIATIVVDGSEHQSHTVPRVPRIS